MRKYNPSEYDMVDDRIKDFYKDHPDGRIITKVISFTCDYCFMKAFVYFDMESKCKATGIAWEDRIKDLSISRDGREYEGVNYSSWVENSETSAVGRALANAGYSGKKRPSREEMEKVSRYRSSAIARQDTVTSSVKCSKCGVGVSSKVAEYSNKKYGKSLCFSCQEENKISK